MAKNQNRVISELHKGRYIPTQNAKRKKTNTHLADQRMIRSLRNSAVTRPFPAEQTKSAKEEITALKQEMEFILGVTKTGLDIIDSQFNIRYIDPEWAKVYGDPTEKKCYEYFMDRSEVCPGCEIPIALKTKRVAVTEETLVKEGNRPIQVTTIPFQDGDGEWLVAEVNVDISERKRTEAALRKAREELEIRVQERTAELARANEAMQAEIIERKRTEESLQKSEEKYRTIIENMQEGHYELDLAGHFTFVNDALCKHLGYTKEELIGTRARQYQDETTTKKMHQIFTELYRTGEPVKALESEYIQKDGTKGDYELSVSLIRDPEGKPIGFRGVSRNITERKRIEGQLLNAAQQWRTTFDGISDIVCLLDREGRILKCNKALTDLLGKPFSEIINRTHLEIVHGALMPIEECPVERLWKTHRRETDILPINDRWFSIAVDPLLDEAGRLVGAVHIMSDVTERKRAEEAIRESEKRYRQVIENAVDIIYTTDANGNFTHANSAALTITGYSLEELQRFNYLDLILPEHRDRVSKIYISQFRQRQVTTYVEFPFFNKSGDVLWFGQNASLVIEGENPVGFHVIARDITDRKRVEQALLESEERYRALYDRSLDCVFVLDFDGKFVDANQAALALLGYARTDISSVNIASLIDERDLSKALQNMHEMIQTGFQKEITEYRLRRKDGGIVYVETQGSVIYRDGKPHSIQGIARDITERKRAEEALRQSEEKYRTILENMQEAYYEIDLAGHFTFFNDALCKHLGYPKEELIGKVYRQYQDETTAKKIYQLYNEIYRTGEPVRAAEAEYIRKDGTKGTYELSVSLLRDTQGKPIGFRGISRDATKRKQAEEALRQSEEKYRTVLESIEEGYYEVDLVGNFTFFNDPMCRLLGYSKDELMGMNNRQYTDQENANRLFQAFNQVYRTREPGRGFDWEIIKKDGTQRIVEASFSLRKDSSGEPIGFRGIVRDITKRKRAEEALRRSEERYRTIIESIQDGYFEDDLAGDFTFVNDVICRHLGYTKEELIGMNYRKYASEENSKKLYRHFNGLYRTGQPIKPFEVEYVRRDGSKLTC